VIGFSGAHRVGKTTLAEAFAKKHDMTFLKTSASEVFKAAGINPAAQISIDTRIAIQESMLQIFDRHYAAAAAKSNIGLFVADRTPIDMAAYLLAEVQQNTTVGQEQETINFATHYVKRCLECADRWFATILIVQPGIQVVEADGKARGCPLFMEHLNTLMLGLTTDERLKCRNYYLPRRVTSLEARLAASERAISRAVESFGVERQMLTMH
jgi:predicted ATPase